METKVTVEKSVLELTLPEFEELMYRALHRWRADLVKAGQHKAGPGRPRVRREPLTPEQEAEAMLSKQKIHLHALARVSNAALEIMEKSLLEASRGQHSAGIERRRLATVHMELSARRRNGTH